MGNAVRKQFLLPHVRRMHGTLLACAAAVATVFVARTSLALTTDVIVNYSVSADTVGGSSGPDFGSASNTATFDRTAMRVSNTYPGAATATQSSQFDAFPAFTSLHTEGTAIADATDDQPFTALHAEAVSNLELFFTLDQMASLHIVGTVSGFTSSGGSAATGAIGVGKVGSPTIGLFQSLDFPLGELDATLVLQPGTYVIGARASAIAEEGPVPSPSSFFDVDFTLEPHPCGQPGAILGTPGDDPQLDGTEGDDIICGLGGNDIIRGFGGNDRIYGGPSLLNQSGLFTGSGDDTIRGGNGKDRIFGEDGNDKLYGDAGADRLLGGPGKDRLFGGSQRDVLEGGPGKDRLYGEGGNDKLVSRDGVKDAVVDGGPGSDEARGDANDPLTSVETVLP